MKGKHKKTRGWALTMARLFFTIPLVPLLGSCATGGRCRPLSEGERVIGAVKTVFAARDTWLDHEEIINIQAYINLLAAAAREYPGDIDVRDIVWVTGRHSGGLNVEVSAAGKVVISLFNK